VAFEDAAASQAGSEPLGEDDVADDAVFEHEDGCKRSHSLQEQLDTLEMVLSNTEGSLAQTKEQLAESDSTVISKFTPSAFFQLID
jgi:hypothetical protein